MEKRPKKNVKKMFKKKGKKKILRRVEIQKKNTILGQKKT